MSQATRCIREIVSLIAPLCSSVLDLDLEVDARRDAILHAVDELREARAQRDRAAEQLSRLIAEYDAGRALSGPRRTALSAALRDLALDSTLATKGGSAR